MIQLKERPCPICLSAEKSTLFRRENFDSSRLTESAFSSRKLPEYMHFQLKRCEPCNMVYASPSFEDGILADAYRDAAFDAGRESKFAARTYYSYLKKYTGAKPTRALDIGAGDGAFLAELRAHGYDDVVGYEPSEAPIQAANAAIRPYLRVEMFDGSTLASDSFGLVTCFQTIEHVYQPLDLLREILRILTTDGTAFLIGHDVEALSARVLGKKSPIFDIEHYQLFSKRSAVNIMRAAGFQGCSVFPIMNSYPLAYWLRLLPVPSVLKQRLLDELSGRWKPVGDSVVSLPAGNLGIIATK